MFLPLAGERFSSAIMRLGSLAAEKFLNEPEITDSFELAELGAEWLLGWLGSSFKDIL